MKLWDRLRGKKEEEEEALKGSPPPEVTEAVAPADPAPSPDEKPASPQVKKVVAEPPATKEPTPAKEEPVEKPVVVQAGEAKMVLELAKELGFTPLELLGKVKELGIDAKSHMTKLSGEEIQRVLEALNPKKKSPATKAKKKTATRKKKAATKKKATTKKKTVAKTASPEAASDEVVVAAKETVIEEPKKETAPKRAGRTIIRRKAKKADEVEAPVPEEGVAEVAPVEGTPSPVAVEAKGEMEPAPTAVPAPEVPEKEAAPVSQEAIGPSEVAPVVTKGREDYKGPRDDKGRPIAAGFIPRKKPAAPAAPGSSSREAGATKTAPSAQTAPPRSEMAYRAKKTEGDDKAGVGGRPEKKVLSKEELRAASELKMYDFKRREVMYTPKKKKVLNSAMVRKTLVTQPKASKMVIKVDDRIQVTELAQRMGKRLPELMKKLMEMEEDVSATDSIDFDTVSLLAHEYGFEVENVGFDEDEHLKKVEDSIATNLVSRRPIVTVMGHVDHGKTSILDRIRKANVADGEAGGITQHIGAYVVNHGKETITFLDTPGHEAFTKMRARGADLTDVAVLVVAADDGVMPQTRESVDHAKAAKVPIVVAINKIDREDSNPEKIKKQLSEMELLAEEWGGDTLMVEVSAKEGTNIDKLLEAILLQAEIQDLKAREEGAAEGQVIESKMVKGRGNVVSVLVKEGKLKKGDALVCGMAWGRVRTMMDDHGKTLKEAGPATPVEILGLETLPEAGDTIQVTANERAAKQIAERRRQDFLSKTQVADRSQVSLEELLGQLDPGEEEVLNIILKADVYGSIEAIKGALEKLPSDKVKVNLVSSQVGGISESDVMLAVASKAVIFGFNIRPETKARQLAEKESVQIKCYQVIYDLVEDMLSLMKGLLSPDRIERFLGRAEVREIFSIPKIGVIAGSSVIDGKINRSASVRLLRDSIVLYEGKVSSLKRFKDDAKEVATGYECGIGIENYNDLKEGDIIEAFTFDEVAAEL